MRARLTRLFLVQGLDLRLLLLFLALSASAAAPLLDYNAALDTPGDGKWEDETGQTALDWTYATDAAAVSTCLPGITHAFSFSGAGATTNSLDDATADPSNESAAFELWFRPADFADNDILLESGGATDGSAMVLRGSNLEFVAKDGAQSAAVTTDIASLGTTDFIQAMVTIDLAADSLRLYVNGALVDSVDFFGSDWAGGDPSGLGVRNSAVGGRTGALGDINTYSGFEGDVAIFRLWDDTLSASEVADSYQAILGPNHSSLSPAPGTEAVALDATLRLTFAEDMQKGAGNIIIRHDDDSIFATIDVANATLPDARTVVIDSPADFAIGTHYTVEMDVGVLETTGGLGYGRLCADSAWRFKALEFTPPAITARSPDVDAINVPITSDLSLTFDEDILAAAGDIRIFRDGTLVETLTLPSSRASVSGASVRIDPVLAFQPATLHRIEIDAAAITDLSGNTFAGGNWSFTSAAISLTSTLITNASDAEILADGSAVLVLNSELYLWSRADASLAHHSADLGPLGVDAAPSADGTLAILATPTTLQVRTIADGAMQSLATASRGRISADNRYALFASTDAVLPADVNGISDVYRTELATGTHRRVSLTAGLAGLGTPCDIGAISPDGRYVAFEDSFHVRLKDLDTGTLSIASTTDLGALANADSSNPRLSSDGRYILFDSLASNLITGDTNGQQDIFRKDLQTGTVLRLASNASLGDHTPDLRYVVFSSGSSVHVSDTTTGASAQLAASGSNPTISADGRYIAYLSAGNARLVENPLRPPAVVSFTRTSTSPTHEDSLTFRVTFDEDVAGVGLADFAANGSTASVTAVVANSASSYDVTLSGGNLASFNGTVGLDFASPIIADLDGNPLPVSEPSTDETYTLDNIAPVLLSFTRLDPSPTNADSLRFRATFGEAVYEVDTADFASSTGSVTAVVANSATEYDITLSVIAFTGVLDLNLAGGHNIADSAGNPPPGEPATDESYTLDNTAPLRSAIVRHNPAENPTTADTLVFRVTFDEPVSNVDAADFAAVGTTATISALVANSATEYDVTVSGGDLAGLNASVSLGLDPAQDITDALGNLLSPTPGPVVDQAYIVSNSPPPTTLVISELLASNGSGLADEDGDFSDWIEIYNPTAAAIDLTGWRLSDDDDDLSKWVFPALSLDAGGFLVVFASDKDRSNPASELHTNFKLSAGGEYLALIQPDGTIAHEFDEYPDQTEDVSYGSPFRTWQYSDEGTQVEVLVPASAADEQDGDSNPWTSTAFAPPGAWLTGPLAVGFGLTEPGFLARYIDISGGDDGQPNTSTEAEAIVNGSYDPADYSIVNDITALVDVIDFAGGGGSFGTNLAYPDGSTGTGKSDFIVYATATVTIPVGNWTIGFGSDDGGFLRLSGVNFSGEANTNGDIAGDDTVRYDTTRGHQWTSGHLTVVGAPLVAQLEAMQFERGGGDSFELAIASGHGDQNSVASGTLLTDGALGWSVVRPVASFVNTDIRDIMQGVNSSAFLRLPFTASEAGSINSLTMSMRYNDGFVAYLNGTEIARRNAPVGAPAWNAASSATRSLAESAIAEPINVTAGLPALVEGQNMLAIHGLNASAADGSFLLMPELTAGAILTGTPTFYETPTPGAPNGASFLGTVADTTFDVDRGFYTTPFALTISSATPDAEIRYSLDGTEPDQLTGLLYTGPLTISATTTLRARAYKTDYYPSNVDTQTYIFLADVLTQSATPAGWPTSNINGQVIDLGMDPDIVNDPTWGPQMITALQQVPTLSMVTNLDHLFDSAIGIYVNAQQHGLAWERPASLELINPDGSKGFQVNMGLRIRGGFSRSNNNPKHAWRFFFRGDYGDPKLEHPMFEDEGVDRFDKLDLRTPNNYSWSFQGNTGNTFLREVFSRDLQGEMDEPYTRSRYYHLYVNGHYWGLHMTQERSEANFAESYFGGMSDDYDVIKSTGSSGGYVVEATDGTTDAYNRMHAAFTTTGVTANADYFQLQGRNPDGTPNPAFEHLLDPLNVAVYMVITYYTGDKDGPASRFIAPRVNNFYGILNRAAPAGFQFFEHDSEHSMDKGVADMVVPLNTGGAEQRYFNPHWMHQELMANEEYAILFADLVYKSFYNDGVLTEPKVIARLQQREVQITEAIIAESARWGDAKTHPPRDKNTWIGAVNTVKNWVSGRIDTVMGQLNGQSWLPATDPPVPQINGVDQYGGDVADGALLSFTGANTVYFTLDGSDPRAIGGAIAAGATQYTTPVALDRSRRVIARVYDSGTAEWSAAATPEFFVHAAASAGNLAISEIQYNPLAPTAAELAIDPLFTNSDFEFIELKNISANPVDLTGASFTDGIAFSFDFDTGPLAPGAYLLVVRNQTAFEARYGNALPVAGVYSTGGLNDGGERLVLTARDSSIAIDDTYNDSDHPLSDGCGPSLHIVAGNPADWHASIDYLGSPGTDESAAFSIKINEVLTHTDLPLVDSIELLNTGPSTVDLSHWYLSDAKSDLRKYRFPAATTLTAGAYLVVDENDFPFALDGAHGDEVWLIAADSATTGTFTHIVDTISFGAAANGESFGAWPNGVGAPYPMITRSLGGANPGPRVGPLVISEVMYHPLANDDDLEYLEILNPTDATVDLTNWQIAGGVDYAFDPGTTIAAGATRLIISFNPDKPENAARVAAFRAAYALDGAVPLLGGWAGTLNNAGEALRLHRPDSPPAEEPGFYPLLLEDEVIYDESAPWPVAADGTGAALVRKHATLWGNDPASWTAIPPNPAAVLQAIDDSLTALEDVTALALDVMANDQGTATLSGFTAPDQGGAISIDGSVLRYTPAAEFSGTERFSYTISQASGAYDSAQVTIVVHAVDDPPIANSANFTCLEDGFVTGQLTATDIDGGPMTFGGQPFIATDGSFTYTPVADFHGTDSFTFSLNGGSTGGATITVTPVAPVLLSQTLTGTVMTLVFDEPVFVGAGSITSPLAIDLSIAGDTVTITPSGLADFASYSITLSDDAIADFAGLSWTVASGPPILDFQTPANAPWPDANGSALTWAYAANSMPVVSDRPGITHAFSGGANGGNLETAPGDPTDASATWELWFRPADFAGNDILLETGGDTRGSSLVLRGHQLQFVAKYDSTSAALSTDITGNSDFIQALVVLDLEADQLRLYVNGALADSAAYTANDWSGSGNAGIGKWRDQPGGSSGALGDLTGFGEFQGDIAIMRLYPEALGADQIQRSYDRIASALIDDHFLNGDLASNPEGQGAGVHAPFAADSAESASAWEIAPTTGSYAHRSIHSKDVVSFGDEPLVFHWEVRDSSIDSEGDPGADDFDLTFAVISDDIDPTSEPAAAYPIAEGGFFVELHGDLDGGVATFSGVLRAVGDANFADDSAQLTHLESFDLGAISNLTVTLTLTRVTGTERFDYALDIGGASFAGTTSDGDLLASELADGVHISFNAQNRANASGRIALDRMSVSRVLPPDLRLQLSEAVLLEGGSTQATVGRSVAGDALTVTLASSDTGEATLPASVTIPAGQLSSVAFTISAVDDGVLDLSPSLVISASAAGHADAAATLQVNDRYAHRLADLTVTVIDQDGNPLPSATLDLQMTRHSFVFGTQVSDELFSLTESQFNALSDDEIQAMLPPKGGQPVIAWQDVLNYRDFSLDQTNHIVPTTGLQWASFNNNGRTIPDAAIAIIEAAGHSLTGASVVWQRDRWPTPTAYFPDQNPDPQTFYDALIADRLSATGILTDYPNIRDWKLLNEPTNETYYPDTFVPGIFANDLALQANYFVRAAALRPDATFSINDYNIINSGNDNNAIAYRDLIISLLAAGAPIDRVGIQAHISLPTISRADILRRLDIIAETGLPIEISEYDTRDDSNQLTPAEQEQSFRDFLEVMWEHPSVEAFIIWGVWDTDHWRGNSPLYNADWSIKTEAAPWFDLVRGEWMPDLAGEALDGAAEWSGALYSGRYTITARSGFASSSAEIDLASQNQLTITLDVGAPSATIAFAESQLSDSIPGSGVRIDFDEPVTGFALSDLTSSGGSLSNFAVLSAASYSATFTASDDLEATASITLDGAYTDLDGNPGGTATATVVVDTRNPIALSSTRLDPWLTTATSVRFLLTFSEAVSGVDVADFASAFAVVANSATEYEVTVSGLEAAEGAVGLDLAVSPTIADSAGNALVAAEPATDQTYRLDNTPPIADAGGPYSGNHNATIVLDASGSSDANGIASVEWDTDNDGQFDDPGSKVFGEGVFTVRLRITDNVGLSATDTASVTGINHPPVANSASFTTAEDTPLSALVTGNDADGDPILFSGPPFLSADGSFTYTPAADFHGVDSFVFYAGSDSAVATIVVTPVNDPPVANSASVTGDEDTALVASVSGSDIDGDDLSFIRVANVASGSLTLASDGAFTYLPAANFAGTDGFTFKANDGAADSPVVAVDLYVAAVNDPPAPLPDSFLVTEDQAKRQAAPGVLANDGDIDGDDLLVSVVRAPVRGALALHSSGAFTYLPPPDVIGVQDFVYAASDGLLSRTTTATLTITNVNDPPVAVADSLTIAEDSVNATVDLLANDVDIDGDALSIVSSPLPYTPPADFHGTVQLNYTVSDGTASVTGQLTVVVTPVNDAPVATADSFTVAEDSSDNSFDLLSNDTDVDGDGLSIVSSPLPYNPPANFHGSVVLPYSISDGTVTVSSEVTIVVTPVNDPPVATADSLTVAEDSSNNTLDLLANDSDIDGDTLSIVSSPLPYTPPANFHGNLTLPYTLTDGTVTISSQLTIVVTPVNDPPVATADSFTILEDSSNQTHDLLANDSDIDGDVLSIVSSPLPYTPPPNFHGSVPLTYSITDGSVTVTSQLTIVVTPVNDPPLATADSITVAEDSVGNTTDLLANDSDIDGDPLSIVASPLPYSPPANFHGSVTLPYSVSDGTVTITSQLTIVVTPVNDPPVAGVDSFTILEDSVNQSYDLLANDSDIDGDPLSIVSSPLPYSPPADFHGSVPLNYILSDGQVSVTGQFTIVVQPVNDAPIARPDSLTVLEDSVNNVANLLTNDSDVDGDSLSFVVIPLPYSPPADFHGNVALGYTITDGQATATSEISIVVLPVNDPPLALPDAFGGDEDQALYGNVLSNDSDVDGDLLSATASHAGLQLATDGSFTYQPAPNFHGSDSFTYTVSDGQLSNTGHVSLTIRNTNDAPVANSASFSLLEDQSLSAQLAGSDIDGDALTFSLVSGPVTLATDGSFSYQPPPDFHGAAAFTFQVNDGVANSAIAEVDLSVLPVNDPPVAVADSVTIAEDSVDLVFDLLANDSDIDGDALSLVSSPMPFSPPADFNGSLSFNYTISDGQASATGQLTIVVTPVNDPPVARADSITVAEDSQNVTLDILANDSDIDGDPLSLVSNPLPFTPPADFNGSLTLAYSISDGTATVNSEITVVVTPVNDPPVAVADSFTILEDSANQTFDLLANDRDVDGDPISILSSPLPYTPPPNFHGPVSLSYAISDGQASSTGQITVHVSSVNDPPIALAASFTGAEDSPLVGQLAGQDIEGQTLSFAGPGFLASDGSFTYLPAPNFHGSDSFAFQVHDGIASSTPVTVQLTITPMNDPPVALPDAFAGAEDQPLLGDLLQNDSDIDGDDLRAGAVSQPTNGSLTLASDGSFTYEPTENFNGSDGFRYELSDGVALTTAEVTISISNDNDVPVANSASFTGPEDQLLIGQVSGSDVDGDALTFALVSGLVSLASDGSFSYQPTANFHGAVDFRFQVNDGLANSAIAQVQLVITPVNDPPVAVADSITVAEDSAGNTHDLLANDSDIDGNTLSIVSSPLPYTPPANFHGTVVLPYSISDGAVTVSSQLSIVVTPVNDVPVAVADSFTISEDSVDQSIDLLANDSDIDGDTLSLVLNPLPYTPAPDFHGTVVLGYALSDGRATVTSQVTIVVTPVNDPPVALPGSFTGPEDGVVVGQLVGSDVEGDGLVFSRAISPESLSTVDLQNTPRSDSGEIALLSDGSFTYTPAPDFHGNDSFIFVASDGEFSDSATITIVVTPVNDPPVARPDSLTVAEDSFSNTMDLLANDSDVDGDPLTIVASPLPYSPPANFHGTVILGYTIFDGQAAATSLLSILVTPVNDQPIARPDAFAGDEDLPLHGDVLQNDSDIDGDMLHAVRLSDPAKGSLTLASNGSFSYLPNPDFNGVDSFSYAASDGQLSQSTTVTLTIANTNDIPVANSASFSTLEDETLTGQLSGSDADGDGLSFSLVNGSVSLAPDGNFSYQPPADFHGALSFTFQVNDGFADSAIAQVDISVAPVNDAPVAVADSFTIAEDSVNRSIDLLANDSDVDGDRLSLESSPLPYTPPPNFHGSVTLGYVISDGQATVSSQVTIVVTPVNDPPVALPDCLTVAEDSASHSMDLLANDSDLDGDALQIVSTPLPYTPAPNFHGTVVLPYVISDGQVSVTGELTVVVTPVNDPPHTIGDSFTIDEDSVDQSIDLLANDSDIDGDALSLVSSPLPYTPPPDFHGAVTLNYVVTDGQANVTSVVTIVVRPVNDAPVAGADSLTVAEDSADNTLDLLVNDSDVDGDALSVVSSPLPYAPPADFHGTVRLPYVISDGVTSVTGELTVVVTPVNDAPVAEAGTFTGAEDGVVVGQLTASDVDGDELVFSGDIAIASNGSFTYVPAQDFHGTASFIFHVSDGQLSSSATATVHITPVNDPPVALADSLTVAEDSIGNTFDLLANDSDIDGDAIRVVTSPLPYSPPADFNGTVTLSYSISDGQAIASGQLTVVVTPVNDPPIARPDSYVIAEDSQNHLFDLLANDSDIDGDALSLVNSPLPYAPPTDFHGSITISYQITDGQTSATSEFTVRVTPVNDAPVALADSPSVDEDGLLVGDVLANDYDVDGDSLQAALVRNVSHGSLTLTSDGSYSYVPTADYFGSDSFSYKINDGLAESATVEVGITVRPVNDAPVAIGIDFTTPEDTPLIVDVANGLLANDYDIDSPFIGLVMVDEPRNGDLELFADGHFSYTPDPNFVGSDQLSYRALDGFLLSDLAIVTFRISAVNDPPDAEPDAYRVSEDGELFGSSVLANDSDIEGDSLSAALHAHPAHGEIDFASDGSFSYRPFANFAGSDAFSYFANDGSANSAATRVSIVVEGENDPPVIEPFSLTTNEDTAIDFAAQTSDVDGDVVTVDRNRYEPPVDFHGVDSFVIVAGDGVATSSFTVQVTVLPVNDCPEIADFAFSTNEETAIVGTVMGTDVDSADLKVERSLQSRSAESWQIDSVERLWRDRSTLVLASDGSFSYNPIGAFDHLATGETALDSFTIAVSDGDCSASATLVFVVHGQNDPPVIQPFSLTTDEDTRVDFSAQTFDIDGDAVTVDRSSYTPAANFHGTDSFVIVADDGEATSSFTVQVTVLPVNDCPQIADFAFSTDEDAVIVGQVAGTDVDSAGLKVERSLQSRSAESWQIDSAERLWRDRSTLVLTSDGSFTYSPTSAFDHLAPGETAYDSYTIAVTDGACSATSTLVFTIHGRNDPPAIIPFSLTTNEDTPVDFIPQTSDIDGDLVTVRPTRYTPVPNFHGTDSFAIIASDGIATTSYTVVVQVLPTNDLPVNTRSPAITGFPTPGNTLTADPGLWADIDGDSLSFSYVWRRDGAVVSTSASYTVTDNDPGRTLSLAVTATDGQASTTALSAPLPIGWQVTLGNLAFGMGDGPVGSDARISIIAPWRPVADSATWVLESTSATPFSLNWSSTALPADRYLSIYEVVGPDNLTPVGTPSTRITRSGTLELPAGHRWFAIHFDAVLTDVLVFGRGWNLCSIPIQPLFAPAFGPLWCEYGGEMQRAEIPDAMRGYWVWRNRPGAVLVRGIPASSILQVAPGANTIGVNTTVTPDWDLRGPIRVWRDDHFRETPTLAPRYGYLIYSDRSQVLSW